MMSRSIIGKYAKVRRGASPRPISDPKYFGGKVGWIRISDVTSSKKFLTKTDQYVSRLGESLSVRVNHGDLIMSICGTIGKPIIINMSACIHDGFVQLYDLNGIDTEFLYYSLQYSEEKLIAQGQPGTQVNLNTNIVSNFEIYVPDLPTQKRIAKILSTVDGQIEKTEAIIAKYQFIKQGMLYDLFTRGIDLTTGKLRPIPEQAPELYKPSPLGLIPKDWKFINFGNKIVSNKYGPRFNANDYSNSGNVKTIRGTDITKNGEILYNQAPKAKLSNLIINANKLIEKDVLIVTTADCGLTTVFCPPIQHENYIPSAYTVRCRFNNDVDVLFIKYYMNTDSAIKQVNSYVRQGTLGNLPSSDILKISLGIPLINEQIKVSAHINTVDSLISKEKLSLVQLENIKKGLMSKLLNGDL
ncbi:MAG: restriction endonuclease subunit S [Burkholderiales bacterium]|nr:restriction endonuclease subunit S [Burkholderiales bacterium]